MKIERLDQFYDFMFHTKRVRQDIVTSYIHHKPVSSQLVAALRQARTTLDEIPHTNTTFTVQLAPGQTINLDLTYEVNELEKDIFFLTHSETEFYVFLDDRYEGFSEQIEGIHRLLTGLRLQNFITDRDGTVSNYCGRYGSSVQSIYNALYLTRFALKNTTNAVILTSAPLQNIGLLDVSTAPPNVFIYAASKGREYVDKKGRHRQYAVDAAKQRKLDGLNRRLKELIKNPQYQKFSLIGSGLQLKFGQTTIARQDVFNSIPASESEQFLVLIKKLLKEVDPSGDYFRIEDTGTDIEIILTIADDAGEGLKDFDKGDAVKFLDADVPLHLEGGAVLICGDTPSDIPMIEVARERATDTKVIFVTQDIALKKAVTAVYPQALFVSHPDILVAGLNKSV